MFNFEQGPKCSENRIKQYLMDGMEFGFQETSMNDWEMWEATVLKNEADLFVVIADGGEVCFQGAWHAN